MDVPDWVRGQRAHLKPVVVGRFGVHPPWLAPVGELPISIDPGPTFGHGAHPTTALCLARIDRLVTAGTSVLDIGCGSGVLSIAAARAGAEPVVGIDVDGDAVTWSRHNAVANGVDVLFSTTPAADLVDPADLVVANMLPSALIAESAHLIRLTGTSLVLSGIPDERAELVADTFSGPLRLASHDHRDGWTGFVFETA